eukprot:COSAG02_NODE_1081_length_14706_cov_994.783939_11_plen_106_part_00
MVAVEHKQGFTSAVSMYAGSMLGLMIGQRWISTDVSFAFMLVLNIVNIPLGCLAMGDRPGKCSKTIDTTLFLSSSYLHLTLDLRRLFHCRAAVARPQSWYRRGVR